MTDVLGKVEDNTITNRTIGRLNGERPGPTLIVVGAIHGNEPAGVEALESVIRDLEMRGGLARGDLLAVTGNVEALRRKVRFVDWDLNRHWPPGSRPTHSFEEAIEDVEQFELEQTFQAAFARARGDVYLLDLHTVSGPGKPFTVFADTIRSRQFARQFPLPLILGLEEHLDGAMIDYVAALGHRAVAVEGGQHDDPQARTNLKAAIWTALDIVELLPPFRAEDVKRARRTLTQEADSLPVALEVRTRHGIDPGDEFTMDQGFSSFDRVSAGQTLARDRAGVVAASRDALLLMPLYQDQGNDGFFLTTPVNPFWLWLSHQMRRAGLGRFVHWLPGVSIDPNDDGVLIINRRVARWGALEILHLLGYRRIEEEDAVLRVRRRRHDLP